MHGKGCEKPIGFVGSKYDKRNQQIDFQNGAIVQVKETYICEKIKNYTSLLRLWNRTNYWNLSVTGTQHHAMMKYEITQYFFHKPSFRRIQIDFNFLFQM